MDEVALRASVTCVVIACTAVVMAIQSQLHSDFRKRKERRAARRRAEHERVIQNRQYAYEGGRRSGRTFASATAAQAAMTSTTTQSNALSQAHLMRAYEAMQQHIEPRDPQMVSQARERQEQIQVDIRAKKDAEELNKEIAEPFWAWHDRREHETKRMVANNLTSGSPDSSIQPGHPDYGMVFGNLASVVRSSGVPQQAPDRQDALAMGLDITQMEAGPNILGNGLRDGGVGIPFYLGDEQGGER